MRITNCTGNTVRHAGLSRSLDDHFVVSGRDRKTAQVERTVSACLLSQFQQILPVVTDVNVVMRDGALVAADLPFQPAT